MDSNCCISVICAILWAIMTGIVTGASSIPPDVTSSFIDVVREELQGPKIVLANEKGDWVKTVHLRTPAQNDTPAAEDGSNGKRSSERGDLSEEEKLGGSNSLILPRGLGYDPYSRYMNTRIEPISSRYYPISDYHGGGKSMENRDEWTDPETSDQYGSMGDTRYDPEYDLDRNINSPESWHNAGMQNWGDWNGTGKRGFSFPSTRPSSNGDWDDSTDDGRGPPAPRPFGRNFGGNRGNRWNRGNRGTFGRGNRRNQMLPSRVFDAVQDVIEDESMFYVTFQCQPKIGKYICKLQCKKRDDRMTGSCESGYCNCMLKEEKKMRKQMSKRFLAAMEGFDTDCYDYKKAKHCKRFCKALTPDKTFTGLCRETHCQCITYPKTPGKNKKNACTKAIKKLKRIEDQALTTLGVQPRPFNASAGATAAADEAIKRLKSANSMDGCTEEDIQNLRGIIANLSQGLNLVKDVGSLLAPPGTPSGTPSGK